MIQIIKRDGRKVPFNQNKIIEAILNAFLEVDGVLSDYAYIKAGNIADYIQELAETKQLEVEQIQDYVEKGLMSTKRKDVARAYISYRDKRTFERNRNNPLTETVLEKISAAKVQNQNANVDEHSFGGRMGEANSAVMRQIALDYIVSDMAKENHINNRIYIHDLDHYAVGDHNCLSIPFDKLLAEGFNTRQTDVRPANSVNTAFQLVAVIFQLQSLQQFGGVSATHLDWTMVPYVRKSFYKHYVDGLMYIENKDSQYIQEYVYDIINDKDCFEKELAIDSSWWLENCKAYKYAFDMTVKETQQAAEGMYHNLNTLQSRSGN